MKASKKFLSLLLVLTMVFSFAAFSASADAAMIIGANNKASSTDSTPSPSPSPETTPSPAPSASQAPEEDGTIIGGDDAAEGENKTEVKTEDDKQVEDEDEVSKPVATITDDEGNVAKYATIQEAIAAANEGDTIELVRSFTLSAPLTISKSVNISGAPVTITFKTSGNYDNALVVDSSALVVITDVDIVFKVTTDEDNNEYGFTNGIFAEDGTAYLANVSVSGDLTGGSKLSNAEDGAVAVAYGEFDFDPSAYVADGYMAVEYGDGYAVVDYAPPATNEIKPTQDGDVIVNKDGTDTTITTEFYKVNDVTTDTTLNLNGKTLTGDITVAAGVTLRIINSGALGDDGKYESIPTAGEMPGNITLNGGKLILENNIKLAGKITMKDNSHLTVVDGSVEVKTLEKASGASADKISGNVTAGKFSSFPEDLQARLIPSGYEYDDANHIVQLETPPAGALTVTDAYSNTFSVNNNYPQYFKGKTELASQQSIVRLDSTEFRFNTSTEPTVYIDKEEEAAKLKKDTDYKWNGSTLTFIATAGNAADGKREVTIDAFEKLDAGAHNIIFKSGSNTATVPVYVWASIETTDVKHVVGSSDKTIAVSDEPVIKVDDKEVKKDGNWSFKDEKLTFNKSYLDGLAMGDHKLSFSFGGGTEFIGNLAIINVTPVDANKDNKWLNSNTALSYNASHAVTAVSVKPSKGDVKTLTKDTDYSVSDKNVLSLKAAFLKQLPYGEHTMEVSLNGETVTVKFTTAPSLVPKDATNHTKGGQKDLVFIASDKMDAVWVGQTKLKTDYYTISSDGKTITLKAAFLNTLKADTTYTITTALMNADGKTAQYSAATSFKIISAATAGATPGTGDSSNFGLWVALLVISGAAIAVILPKKHKEN